MILSFWLWLYYAALWVWDWMRTAAIDPNFRSYRIADLRLFEARADLWPGRLEITIDWFGRFEIYHPIDQIGWRAKYLVDYAYPIDPDRIPF